MESSRNTSNLEFFLSDLDQGILLQSQGRHREAVKVFTSFLERDPLHTEALFRRATSLSKLELFELSTEDFLTLEEVRQGRKPFNPSRES
jgi:hypothetical protein